MTALGRKDDGVGPSSRHSREGGNLVGLDTSPSHSLRWGDVPSASLRMTGLRRQDDGVGR